VPKFRVSEAAALLGVSDDTVRRWIDVGELPAGVDDAGRKVVDGADLANHAAHISHRPEAGGRASARNRFTGLVLAIRRDTVMAQVDIQCGPFRVVSLISAEAVDELELTPGSLVVASIKSTNVVVELP